VINNTGNIIGDVNFTTASGDSFLMNRGQMTGQLLMGTGGNETATFENTTDANTNNISVINGGGDGNDQLIFNNANFTGVSRLVNWETITLQNAATLNLDNTLILGGTSADKTATLSIQNATLNATTHYNSIIEANAIEPATVNNAGLINIASPTLNNSLTVRGDYVGAGGTINLNAMLNDDAAAADKLIIDGQMVEVTAVATLF